MPVEHRFDPDLGTLFARGIGRVTDAEMLAYAKQVASDHVLPAGHRQLMDLRRVETFDLTADGLRDVASIFVRLERDPDQARVAIVVEADVGFGIARMYQAFRDESAVPLRVFRDLDEACSWLGLPPGEP